MVNEPEIGFPFSNHNCILQILFGLNELNIYFSLLIDCVNFHVVFFVNSYQVIYQHKRYIFWFQKNDLWIFLCISEI